MPITKYRKYGLARKVTLGPSVLVTVQEAAFVLLAPVLSNELSDGI
ncbi:hypothetical protein [Arcanobacterium phocae]|nr:hypothetical protein [Arcanobacterium phocae]